MLNSVNMKSRKKKRYNKGAALTPVTQALYTHLTVQSLFRAPVANSGAGRKPRGIVCTPTWRAPGRTGPAGGQDGTAYKTAVACTVPSLLMATNERVGGPGAVNELGLVPKHCPSHHRYHNRVRECFCAKLCPSPETFLFCSPLTPARSPVMATRQSANVP